MQPIVIACNQSPLFGEQAPHLYAPLNDRLRREYAAHVATLQQNHLRLVRQYNESKVLLLKMVEARLRQAVDYHQVLHREAVENAKAVTATWAAYPVSMLREELEVREERRLVTCNLHLATCNLQLVTCNL